MVIDKKSLEAAKQMQRLYIYMYKEVYLHKSALISQRFLQKMIAMLISLDPVRSSLAEVPKGTRASGASETSYGMDPSKLWELNDSELLALIYTNKNQDLRFLYDCFKNRILPRTGLVIRLKNREIK